jgi:hypothetical protein
MPIRSIFASVLVALFGQSAMAECVTAADLERGIRVTFDNGDTTTLRAVSDGMTEVFEYMTWNENIGRYQTYLGLYYVDEIMLDASGEPQPETRRTTRYDVPVTELPVPQADLAPLDLEIMAREFTRSMMAETQSLVFGPADPIILDGCIYKAIAVGQRDRPGEATQRDKYYYYLPDLGVAFIVAWTNGLSVVE